MRRSQAGESQQVPVIVISIFVFIFAAGASLRLYFLDSPIRYDEAFTFLHYVLLPFNQAIADYTLPNNHILHTLLVKITTGLCGREEWAIRLPAFIAGLCLLPAMFFLGWKAINIRVGLWAAALVAASSGLVEYSVNARGYSMVCLATVLLLATTKEINLKDHSIVAWTVFVLASVAGLFTVPVMIFPLLTVTTWIILGADLPSQTPRFRIVKKLILVGVIIGLGTVLCYTPVILKSGWESLLSNRFVKPLPIVEFGARLPKMGKNVFIFFHRDLPLTMTLLLAAGFLVGCFRLPRLATAVFISVSVLMLIQRVLPPPRVFTFGLVIYLFLAAVGFDSAFEKLLKKVKLKRWTEVYMFLPALWILVGVFLSIHGKGPLHSPGRFPEAEKVVKYLLEHYNNNDYFMASVPAIEPITYYGTYQGTRSFGDEWSGNQLPKSIKAVVNRRIENVKDLGKKYRNTLLLYSEPKFITAIDSAEIYDFGKVNPRNLVNKPQALEYLKELQAKDALNYKEINFFHNFGTSFAQNKDLDNAIALFETVLQYQPNNFKTLYNLGVAFENKSLPDKASQYYKRLLGAKPADTTEVKKIFQVAMILMGMGESKFVAEFLERFLKDDSTVENLQEYPFWLFDLGATLSKQRKYDEATDYFQKAIDIKPDFVEAHLNLGSTFAKLGLFDKAERHYKTVLRLDPDNSSARHNLSVIKNK